MRGLLFTVIIGPRISFVNLKSFMQCVFAKRRAFLMRFTVKRIKFKRNEVHFIEVKIPKEIRQYKESIFFGLSARQFFCSLIAILIAAGVYLLLGKVIGKESASWLCIVLAAPAAMAGFFSYNGMTFEQFLWAVIKTEYLCYGGRKYISDSAYYKCFNRKGRGDFD